MRPAHCRLLIVLCLLSALIASPAHAGKIDAVRGRQYELTKRHGPWMIMVASFHAASADGKVRDGKTPQQLADELVYELRTLKPNGIPAYTYSIAASDEVIETVDRLGREEERKLLTSQDQVCVIAGNYRSFNDETAQSTLKWIKKYNAQCLQQKGVKYLKTSRRQGPLGGAFMTINPLLSPEEVKSQQHDPLLVKLNAGHKYSLFENKGKYSLVVATFGGKKMAHIGDSNSPEAQAAFKVEADTSTRGSDGFGRFWKKTEGNDLDAASRSAWELAVSLREFDDVDSYVWHDRYQSVVTVGSFESPNDPKLKAYMRVFAPSPIAQVSGTTGDQVVFNGAPSNRFGIAAGATGNKIYGVEGFGENGKESRLWAFDPNPMLMLVPDRR